MDAARYGRIWEVSIRGARAPETAGLAPVGDGRARGHRGPPLRARRRSTVLADVRDAAGDGAHRGRAARPDARARRGRVRAASLHPDRADARTSRCGSRSRRSRSAPSSSATSGSPTCSRGATSARPGTLEVEIGGRVVASASRRASTTAGSGSPPRPRRGRPTSRSSRARRRRNRLICFAAEARR